LILKIFVKQDLVTRLLNNLRFTAHTLSTYESRIKQPSDDTHNRGCPSRALKRFPRDTEGILQGIQGRLIVPVEVDGHRDVRDTTRGSSQSTDSARHSTWRQSVSYPVRNCPGTMNRFPSRGRRDYFGRYYLSILSSRFPC